MSEIIEKQNIPNVHVSVMEARDTVFEFSKPLYESENIYYYKPLDVRTFLYNCVKRVFDFITSSILLILLSPFLLIISIIIKTESPGKVIYKRRCIGKRSDYYMLKFRSMVSDAGDLDKYFTPEQKEQYLKEVKVENDPRITRIGRFIRKTSIDELPQLLNVLKGEMSLVGPRPVAPEDMKAYGRDLPKVLSVKPGMTGYWQTHGRSNITYESGERQKMELHYVENCSILMDLKILIDTVLVVLKKEGVS